MSDLSWFRNRFPYTKMNDINLDWLLKRMKELSALVVSYADDIRRALTQSSTAIIQSETAVNSANNAVTIANNASATADAVSGIAEDARTIASTANSTAIHASDVANAIAETAQSALDTAQSAETIAGNAAQTADDAQTTAQNAVTIANGANTRAGNAEQSALTAINTASAAQQTAANAAQSAQMARLAATAAAQDAQSAQQAATAAAQNADTAQQTATAAALTATTAAQDARSAQQAATTAAQDARTVQQAATTISINKADVIKETISGNVVSFPDGADGLPLEKLVVRVDVVQSGNGDPSPDNIRPISGWNGCNISHSGEDTSNPTVITINWQTEAGTAYGGTLDLTTGVLTITHHMMQPPANISILSSGIYLFSTPAAFLKKRGKINVICDMLNTSPNRINLSVSGSSTTSAIYCRDDSCEDVESFKRKYSSAMFVYELDSPINYQLTPQEVTTLMGTNNIWADCGPVIVEYRADTKLYIEKINAPSGYAMIANQQITSGKYFVIGGSLYKSTTVIAQGDTIIPQSNCIETNLADALNTLL